MSIVKMRKMSLVAHSCERTKLLRIFIKAGCVELTQNAKEIKITQADRERKELMEMRKFRASFFLNFFREMSNEIIHIDKKLAPKFDLKKENRLIPMEEYEEVCNNSEELFMKIDELEHISNKITDLKSERTRLIAFKEQLLPYKNLSVEMSKAKDTRHCSVYIGMVDAEKSVDISDKLNNYGVYEICDGEKTKPIIVICLKKNSDAVRKILSDSDFIPARFDFDGTVAEKISKTETRIFQIDEEIKRLILSTRRYDKYVSAVKIVYDYYALETAKLDITEKSERTKKAIAFEGWVPAEKEKLIADEISEKCSRVVFEFRDVLEGEIPPTLIKTNKVVGAFSGITEMFGSPNYKEQDPNLFVALFFFLIFGIMIGDAGYGLLMTVACFLFLKIKKPVKNSGKMIAMFGFCGISTFLWGILFGGWFSINIEGTIFEKIMWFSPLNEPLKMFMLSLAIGILQIGTGFALSGIAKIKSHDVVKGILSDFGWVIIFVGLLLLFPNIMVYLNAIDYTKTWFGVAGKIGTYTAIVGAVMMIVGGAWGKKNPIKMVGGAFGSIYGGINIVSDILSYSRLFGLGLTTGVIGLVMNELGMIIVNMLGPVGWIFAVVIFVGGHTFNLAINLLGAYVHDSRLQYIEFFGRFYDGSGHAFKPLGGSLKYTYLDN